MYYEFSQKNIKNNFQKSPLNPTVSIDDESRCDHNTRQNGANFKNLKRSKPVAFKYYKESDIEYFLPSGCQIFFENDCKECFKK